MSVSAEELRLTMRTWATGVTVVGVRFNHILHGMTVSSFTSLSLEPPLVLVSLEIGTRTHQFVEKTGTFGVSILAAHQEEVSNCFANPSTDLGDRFSGREVFYLETGAPFVTGGLAFFDCRVVSVYPAGNHVVYVAEVVATQINPVFEAVQEPLLYFNRNYRTLKELD